MKGGVLLVNVDCGQTTHALVRTIEGGDEMLLIVMRDVQLQTEPHAVAFQRALPDSFGDSDGSGWLLRAESGGLPMKDQGQAGAALDPVAFDAGMNGRELSFIGGSRGGHIKMERGILQRESGHFNAVDALIQTVDSGMQGAVRGLGYVQNEMQHCLARLQRAAPMPFQRGGMPLRLGFMSSGSLG